MQRLKIIFIILCGIFLFTACVSDEEKVQEVLISDLTNTKNVDKETIDSLIEVENVTETTENEKVYKDIVIEMSKDLEYNIVSTEKIIPKDKKKDNKKVLVTVDLTTKNIDSLVTEFFQNIANDMAFSYMLGENIDKDKTIQSAYKTMLKSYEKIDTKTTSTVVLEYENIEKNNWKMLNRDEYTNVVLGSLFTKISTEQENVLPNMCADAVLKSIKEIKPEQVNKLIGNELDGNNAELIKNISTQVFNTLEYEYVSTQKEDENTIVNYKIKTIDSKKIVAIYEDRFTSYFKEKIDTKKVPDSEQLVADIFKIFSDIVSENIEQKSEQEMKIVFNKNYQITNGSEFMDKIMDGLWGHMGESAESIQKRINDLLKK